MKGYKQRYKHGYKGIKTKKSLGKKMISLGALMVLMLTTMLSVMSKAYGSEGEIGFFGGISEGDYLPKNIEKHVNISDNKTPVYAYKEMIFISGEPVEVTGTITVDVEDDDIMAASSGIYKERYIIKANNKANDVTLARSLSLNTAYWIYEGEFKRQIIKDSELVSWVESITTPTGAYSLDSDSAIFSKATVEDITAGVAYYSTTLSYSGIFKDADGNEISVVVENNGDDIYGYKQPWSKVETQKLTMSIRSTDLDLSMDITLNPRLEAKKTIYYNENQPFPISFGGTYNQRMEREATLEYEIISQHSNLTPSQKKNELLLTTANEIEKLPIPEGLDFIEGHWAEDDLKKLYSMQIFTEVPHEGMHFEAMTRGDFVKALCLTMDIDTSPYETINNDSQQIFGDVGFEHPLYPYIMGAYHAKLVKGTGEDFDVNVPITREEAFVIYIRVEIVAGYRLGIIKGDDKGRVNPKQWISKAEAAAIINRLIDYLREEIGKDY